MNAPHPILRVLLQASPAAPGARALLARAARAAAEGSALQILLVDGGLDWAKEPSLSALAEREGVRVALCSRSAREQGGDPDGFPPWIRWSSLIAWLRDHDPADPLWAVLP